ncbi:MAG: HAD family hydrolase [Nocardioides sp.]
MSEAHASTTPRVPPKLVATDLDGTLLTSEGVITPRTRRTLDAVARLGVPVVVVTGRPVRWMERLWDEIGGHRAGGLGVLSNGAIVYDVARREVRDSLTISARTVLEVTSALRREIPGVVFALEQGAGLGREPGFLPKLDNASQSDSPATSVAAVEDLLLATAGDVVVKLLVQHDTADPEAFWAEVDRTVGHLVTTTWSSAHAMVEVSGPGVTKAATLARVARECGVRADEVLALGDMPNDVPMLEWAGTAYAMENAHPAAIAAAGRSAPSNDQDGVAVVLEEAFGLS